MKVPTVQFAYVVPAALAGASICLSLFLLRGGGEPLQPLPVVPVVDSAAGSVATVLRAPTHILARPHAELRLTAETQTVQPAAQTVQPSSGRPMAKKTRTHRQAPPARVKPRVPAPTPTAVQPRVSLADNPEPKPASGPGNGKALGRDKPKVSAPAKIAPAPQGNPKKQRHEKLAPAQPKPQKAAAVGKDPKPQKAPPAGKDPKPNHGQDKGGHDAGESGGGKK